LQTQVTKRLNTGDSFLLCKGLYIASRKVGHNKMKPLKLTAKAGIVFFLPNNFFDDKINGAKILMGYNFFKNICFRKV